MKINIPYARQDIDDSDVQAVVDILRSDWLTQGPVIEQFELACANYSQAKFAVAVNSATSALHLACMALNLGPNDILWTSPNTFVASSNCALYCGAKVDFVDIDPKTYNMSVEALAEKCHKAEKEGRLPKVVVVVHFAGQSCEMDKIKQLSDRYGFKIIEDASHAIGGQYKGKPIGACEYSDCVVFSFHPVKIITTGEGGLVLTNSPELKDKINLLRSHGVTRNPDWMEGESHGAWYYQQIALGYNYRITDIQAGLGLSQLKRIDDFIRKRQKIAQNYHDALAKLPLEVPWQLKDCYSALHLYPIQLHIEKLNKSRREVFDALRQAGIGVNVHYIPVHTQPYYRKLGFKMGDFPVAERYYERAISLPIHFRMSEDEQQYVIKTLSNILS